MPASVLLSPLPLLFLFRVFYVCHCSNPARYPIRLRSQSVSSWRHIAFTDRRFGPSPQFFPNQRVTSPRRLSKPLFFFGAFSVPVLTRASVQARRPVRCSPYHPQPSPSSDDSRRPCPLVSPLFFCSITRSPSLMSYPPLLDSFPSAHFYTELRSLPLNVFSLSSDSRGVFGCCVLSRSSIQASSFPLQQSGFPAPQKT